MELMREWHDALNQRHKWYADWHEMSHHQIVHWAVFLFIGILATAVLTGQISKSVSAATGVSEVFLNELLNEPDIAVKLQKARDVGLTVESYIYDEEEFHLIIDPATGKSILSLRISSLNFGLHSNPARPATCDSALDSSINVLRASLQGMMTSKSITISKPSGMSDSDFNTLKQALRNAIIRINADLGQYDTAKVVPRYIDALDSGTGDVKVNYISSGDYGQMVYQRTDNTIFPNKERMTINVDLGTIQGSLQQVPLNSNGLTNIFTHELGHGLGLGHNSSQGNLMRPGGSGPNAWTRDRLNNETAHLNKNQAQALINFQNQSTSVGLILQNCRPFAFASNRLSSDVNWSSYINKNYVLLPEYIVTGNDAQGVAALPGSPQPIGGPGTGSGGSSVLDNNYDYEC